MYEGNMKRLTLSKVDLWPWRYWAEDAIDLALHRMSAHSMPKVILTSKHEIWAECAVRLLITMNWSVGD